MHVVLAFDRIAGFAGLCSQAPYVFYHFVISKSICRISTTMNNKQVSCNSII